MTPTLRSQQHGEDRIMQTVGEWGADFKGPLRRCEDGGRYLAA